MGKVSTSEVEAGYKDNWLFLRGDILPVFRVGKPLGPRGTGSPPSLLDAAASGTISIPRSVWDARL